MKRKRERAAAGRRKGAEIDRAARAARRTKYVLRLYVAGLTPRSTAAIESVKEVCEEHLKGRYDLQIVDIYHAPTLARGEQIIAAPTLIRKLPAPLRRIIGDMADRRKLLVGLDLIPRELRHRDGTAAR
jgi:circadian clock protein KaiB